MHEREQQVRDFVAKRLSALGLPYSTLIYGAVPRSTLLVSCGPQFKSYAVRVVLGHYKARRDLTPVLQRIAAALDMLPVERIRDAVEAYEERTRAPKLSHEEMERLLA